jgi:gliding motility associated protien GldN
MKPTFAIIILACVTVDSRSQSPGPTPSGIVLQHDYIREADVFWKKRIWRVIDTRLKLNLPFAYPKEPLVALMIKGIEEGVLTPYDHASGDDFEARLSDGDWNRMMHRIDTVCVPNPRDPTIDTCFPIDRTFDPGTVTKFRIKEDWIFDEERSEMVVRIVGIAPVRDVMDPNTGEKRGESILFWINYEEARPFLASHFAFNPQNDFVKATWDDVFEMRLFESYIVKEENELDREIQEYASGVDAILESDRIEKELFTFEHELWHY